MNKQQLKKLFLFATTQTHFLYNGQYFDQIDGVAMGSPLGPVLANLFLGYYEKNWIEEYQGSKPFFYCRYVDDIFCAFEHQKDIAPFFEYLNDQHINIRYTIENEINNRLPFLDVSVTKNLPDKTIELTTYKKPTNNGLLLNFTSFAPYRYKINLIKIFVFRSLKINSSLKLLNIDLSNIKNVLMKNCYPLHIINRVCDTAINKFSANKAISNPNKNKNDSQIHYISIPYIGSISVKLNNKIRNLFKKYCKKDSSIKISFKTFKLKSYFSNKDVVPKNLCSCVVYKFVCVSCNACYIGETIRHFQTRINEHVKSDTNSMIFKHLVNNSSCKNSFDINSFKIIDSASSDFQLKIKEALHIQNSNPILNSQVKSYKTALNFIV